MICTKMEEKRDRFSKKTSVALGSFDALHRGHIQVISAAVEYAKENDLISVVQLLDVPNPLKVNDDSKRYEILERLGVQVVLTEPFTDELRRVKYDEFVSEYLQKSYNAAAVFVGENYRFGHMAEGDVEKLSVLCNELGIKVFVNECLSLESVISSTEIRKFITNGEMEKVTEYMGRPFSLKGQVLHGKGLGRTMGFPTANLEFPPDKIMPKSGVYSTRVIADEKSYFGITNVGAKPTVEDTVPGIETFLIDYEGNLYGKEIEVEFLKRIRDTKKFESTEKLKEQIEIDKQKIKGTKA